MTSDEAIVEIRKGFRLFKAFEHFEEVAVWAQNVEQVARETLASTEALKADKERLTTEIAAIATDIEKGKEEAKAVRADAKKKGDERIAKAEADAAAVAAKASAEADAAAKITTEAKATVKAIQEEVKLARAELDDLNKKIASAKEQIKSLLA